MHTEFWWRIFWKSPLEDREGEGDEDNIQMNLTDVGCEDGRWMKLAQDQVFPIHSYFTLDEVLYISEFRFLKV
jgi:hypothetical protein